MKKKSNNKTKLKAKYSYQLLYTINAISGLKSFKTLDELRIFGEKNEQPIENVLVYRVNESSGVRTAIPPSKYAHKIKVFNINKSNDGSGFYEKYSWVKVSEFQQKPILPLPIQFTKKDEGAVIDVFKPEKTFLGKTLDFIRNSLQYIGIWKKK